MKISTSHGPKKHSAFTLVEMLVVLLVITILIGIGLAVGTQVENSSESNLTKTELKNLQAALNWYIHKSGGQVPANMGQFLQDYQLDHATPGPNGTWKQTPDVLTALPQNLVVSGTFNGPTGSNNMTGVICVLDGFGNPIQYMPPGITQSNAPMYADPTGNSSATASTSWLSTSDQALLPTIIVSPETFQNSAWQPSPNHAPYFYSFGPVFSSAQSNTSSSSTFGPSDYIYSYNQ
jgi:prepilin-type N-terminal cleavage/methylation domain-containing protein